jgi:hypothetical protein
MPCCRRDDRRLTLRTIDLFARRARATASFLFVILRRTKIKRVFEITPPVVTLELGTLAREFESSVKAPRIRDLRT